MSRALLGLVPVTLSAAIVNGALGHGFSSITVPIAVLSFANRVLNPALVLAEVVINGSVLIANRSHVAAISGRVAPVLAGLVPGVVVGSYLLAVVDPAPVKLLVFAVLLPLILLQAAGVRRPLRSERAVGVPLGAGIGVLYALTTISGPPLALMLNNQGLPRPEFRAALGLIRVVESGLAAAVYGVLGLYTAASAEILLWIMPTVLVGIPVGAWLIDRVEAETFRRVCMSFDAWIVGFGLSRLLADLGLVASPGAYGVWAAVVLVDAYLLRAFFVRRRVAARQPP